jgi:hypothetical protein
MNPADHRPISARGNPARTNLREISTWPATGGGTDFMTGTGRRRDTPVAADATEHA